MPRNVEDKPAPSDALSLAHASITELVDAIDHPDTVADDGNGVPPLANQVARLIISEAVRLIRLGTRAELASAADHLAQWAVSDRAVQLEKHRGDAYRLVSGATVALDAAVAPSSRGGELAVLRSWKKKALEVVVRVSRAEGQMVPRSELLGEMDFGDAAESSLSHLLAELEAAGLIVRIREGRRVMVHLGPAATSDHVQEAIHSYKAARAAQSAAEMFTTVREALQPLLDKPKGEALSEARGIDGAQTMIRHIWKQLGDATDITATLEALPNGGSVPFQVKISGHDLPLLVASARVEDGAVREVVSYAALADPPRAHAGSRPTSRRGRHEAPWSEPQSSLPASKLHDPDDNVCEEYVDDSAKDRGPQTALPAAGVA